MYLKDKSFKLIKSRVIKHSSDAAFYHSVFRYENIPYDYYPVIYRTNNYLWRKPLALDDIHHKSVNSESL
jgi:hypothetical protein